MRSHATMPSPRLKVGDRGVERTGVASVDDRTRAPRASAAAPPRRSFARLALQAFAGGLLLSVAVGIAVFKWGDGGVESHLPVGPPLSGESLLLAVVVLTVSLVLHECAHALVAALLDFRVVEIRIGSGPRLLRCHIGSTALDLRLVPSFGYVRHVPKNGVPSRRRSVAVVLAGPVATVITLMAFIVFAPGPWKFAGLLVAIMKVPTNLLPLEFSREGRRFRNDALRIRDLMRGGDQKLREWTIAYESENVILLPLELGDLDAFIASMDDEVLRLEGFTAENVQQFRAGFAQFVNYSYQRWPRNLAVRDRATSEFLGCCQFYEIDPAGSSAQLGWWQGARGRGRGLGFESLELALRYAHIEVGIRRIIMGTTRDDESGIVEIERAGATFTHEAPHTLPNGETVTAIWFEHT
jgi:RimJ/RimL family protein N-acetyltransferase